MKEHKLLINGSWVNGFDVKDITSPYDNSQVARVHFASPEQVEEAIQVSHSAFDKTKALSSHERSTVLENISDSISKNHENIARSITLSAGKTIKSSRIEVSRGVNTFQIAAEESKRITGEMVPLDLLPETKQRWGIVRQFPIGTVVGITPFNFPLNLVAHKVAPAIAAGNTIILRPASQVSPTSALLSEIIQNTEYPDGGFNFIPCGYQAAECLLEDERIKKISFTGSPEIGWQLKKKAYKKRITLELGGNAAVIVEPDADLEYALSRIVLGSFSYSGQICISIQRVFLHEKIYDRFMADFLQATQKLIMGDPMDEKTDIGPMITLSAAKQTEEWINEAVDKGAKILTGGRRDGVMFEPTILENVDPELRISWLEAFAPVAVVYRYNDFAEAINEVNHSIYGLQAGVFSNDLKKAFHAYEKLDVGGVIVNDIPTFRIDHMPYGGVKESGFGREGIRYAIEEMTELKLMAINLKE